MSVDPRPPRYSSLMASKISNNPSVNVLSLDGGGIRGVSQLIILDEIMQRIQAKKQLAAIPKPCEYFHLIGGSGTGGLSAIMLGRLKMSTEDILKSYNELPTAVFNPNNRRSHHKEDANTRFGADLLESEVKEIVTRHSHANAASSAGDERLLDSDTGKDSTGHAFVCTKTIGNMDTLQLLRTYVGPNQGPDCMIWEAIRATTATPTIFRSITIAGRGGICSRYYDASWGHNNPSRQVRAEANQLFGSGHTGLFLSVGTGHPGPAGFQVHSGKENLDDMKDILQRIANDCEDVASALDEEYYGNKMISYFRLNVTHGPGQLDMVEWGKEGEVYAHTMSYLRGPDITRKVETVVEYLCSYNVKS